MVAHNHVVFRDLRATLQLLKTREGRPAGIAFRTSFQCIRQIHEEIESGPLLYLIDRNIVVGETVVRVGLMLKPEADSTGISYCTS